MVPIAPSSTRMRSASAWRSIAIRVPRASLTGPESQRVADRVRQLGAVERVEVELADAFAPQPRDLLDRDRGCDQPARLRVVFEALEALGEPVGHGRTAARGKPQQLRKPGDRQDAGNDRGPDAVPGASV